jgi:glycosyltransferase involved in cell wall biosynthesis
MACRASPADKLKILFVHGAADIGGAERELLRIVDRLPSAGYEPRVACPAEGQLPDELNRRGIPHAAIPVPPWRKLLAFAQRSSSVRRLREVIENDPPTLVHVNDMWWVPQAIRAVQDMGIPVVAHVRQEIEPTKVRQYELERVDLVFAVSRHVQSGLVAGGVLPQRLRVLHSGVEISVSQPHDGIDLRRHLALPAHARVIGTVANLFPRKGLHIMLQALPSIVAAVPEAHYVVIGSGDKEYVTRLQRMVDDHGLQNHVHYLGYQHSINPYLAGFDLYVHPALMEGFGIAVLEAMAMGKPVVATRTGGLPEIVEDGVTGLLVPAGDSAALAVNVLKLLEDPDRALTMGHAGWQRARDQFSWSAMLAELTSGYTQVARSIPVS